MNIRRLAEVLALPIAVALVFPRVAAATQVSGGSIELSPKVSFSHSNLKREGYGNVDTFTEFDFTPTAGFCFTDHFEATGGAIVRHQSLNVTSETALGFLAGFLYNFSPQGGMIPFAGLGFGTLFYDGFTFNDTAVLAPSLTGGIRLLVRDAASVNLSLGYEHETDGQVSTNRMVAGVGVSLFPWRTR